MTDLRRWLRHDRRGLVRPHYRAWSVGVSLARTVGEYAAWNWKLWRRGAFRRRPGEWEELLARWWFYAQHPVTRVRARRIVRGAAARWGVAASAAALIFASIASPTGMGNDGQRAYDLATRTWFGSVMGNVFAAGKPWYDVTSQVFQGGAKGNGINDDTGPIQSALANVGVIFFPPGSYVVSQNLTPKAGQSWRGAGMLTSILAPTTAVTALISWTPGVLTTGALEVSDLELLGNASTAQACNFTHLTLVLWHRVHITGFNVSGNNIVSWSDVETSQQVCCWYDGVGSGGNQCLLSSTSNNDTFLGTAFISPPAAGSGLQINSTVSGCLISGCDFEGNSTGNVGIFCSGTLGVVVTGCFMELWTGAAIAANTGTALNLTIQGNQLHATNAAPAMVILNSAGPNQGVHALNNTLQNLGLASASPIGFLFGNTTAIVALGNRGTGGGPGILSVAGTTLALPDYVSASGFIGFTTQQRNVVTSAASPGAIDASAQEVLVISVGAAYAVPAPTNGKAGQILTLQFVQTGAGGFAVTWNAVFIRVSWSDAGNVPNARSSISFLCLDGTNYLQQGAQKLYS